VRERQNHMTIAGALWQEIAWAHEWIALLLSLVRGSAGGSGSGTEPDLVQCLADIIRELSVTDPAEGEVVGGIYGSEQECGRLVLHEVRVFDDRPFDPRAPS